MPLESGIVVFQYSSLSGGCIGWPRDYWTIWHWQPRRRACKLNALAPLLVVTVACKTKPRFLIIVVLPLRARGICIFPVGREVTERWIAQMRRRFVQWREVLPIAHVCNADTEQRASKNIRCVMAVVHRPRNGHERRSSHGHDCKPRLDARPNLIPQVNLASNEERQEGEAGKRHCVEDEHILQREAANTQLA